MDKDDVDPRAEKHGRPYHEEKDEYLADACILIVLKHDLSPGSKMAHGRKRPRPRIRDYDHSG